MRRAFPQRRERLAGRVARRAREQREDPRLFGLAGERRRRERSRARVEGAEDVLDGPPVHAVVIRQGRGPQQLEPTDVSRLDRDLLAPQAYDVAPAVRHGRHQRREDVTGLGEPVGQRLPQQRLGAPRVAVIDSNASQGKARVRPREGSRRGANRRFHFAPPRVRVDPGDGRGLYRVHRRQDVLEQPRAHRLRLRARLRIGLREIEEVRGVLIASGAHGCLRGVQRDAPAMAHLEERATKRQAVLVDSHRRLTHGGEPLGQAESEERVIADQRSRRLELAHRRAPALHDVERLGQEKRAERRVRALDGLFDAREILDGAASLVRRARSAKAVLERAREELRRGALGRGLGRAHRALLRAVGVARSRGGLCGLEEEVASRQVVHGLAGGERFERGAEILVVAEDARDLDAEL